ncbi:VanZ family protein [Streptomyces sp. DSM 118148]|uniref:VanZ family protein n=1 Tax=Streptomyces sp. DSM 118148 TaxID=3448667 RepID=UPI00403FF42F
MISAILSAQPLLLFVLATSSAVLTVVGFLLGRRFNHSKRLFWSLAGAGMGVALSATLTPARSSSNYSGTCTISKDFLQSVDTEQWLLNLALLVPVCLFLILAGASYATSIMGVATLSMAIEFTQATLPGIGRACDSDDFIANISGAILISAVVFVTSSLKSGWRNMRSKVVGSSRGLMLNSAAIALVAIAGLSTLTMTFVDSSTPIKEADSSQRRAVAVALEALFGNSLHLTRVQVSNLPDGDEASKQTLIASWENGNAELSWPDAKIHKIWSSDGVAFAGRRGRTEINDASAAKAVTAKFAARNFAWTSAATKISTKGDSQFPGAWRVTYQQKQDDIIMPLNFSVVISRSGRLLELTADEFRTPDQIPPVKVTLTVASETAASHAPPGSRLSTKELRLLKRGSTWFTAWDFTYSRSSDVNNYYNPVSVLIDATTGKFLAPDAMPRGVS